MAGNRVELITTDGYIKNVITNTKESICMHTEYLPTECITCVRLLDLREFLDELGITLEDCQRAFEEKPTALDTITNTIDQHR